MRRANYDKGRMWRGLAKGKRYREGEEIGKRHIFERVRSTRKKHMKRKRKEQ